MPKRTGANPAYTDPAYVHHPTKASEVISNALLLWDEGRRWVSGTIGTPDKGMCFYGGIGWGSGAEAGWGCWKRDDERLAALHAEKLILDELEAQGFPKDIIDFNDITTRSRYTCLRLDATSRYDAVHKIACGALKRALKEEETQAATPPEGANQNA